MAKKRSKPAAPQDPESYLKLSVNGHMLTGEKRDGKWSFVCEDWPEMAARLMGMTPEAPMPESAIAVFMSRALEGAVTVKGN